MSNSEATCTHCGEPRSHHGKHNEQCTTFAPTTDPLTATVRGWLSDAHDVWPDDRAALIAERVRGLIADERERIAQAIEAMESFAHGKNPTSAAHLIGYGTARRLAARIARGVL